MVSMKLQKRLAANVMNCGKGKAWIDTNERIEIKAKSFGLRHN
ncbi:unnamed protein product [Rhodiola kirilowii]